MEISMDPRAYKAFVLLSIMSIIFLFYLMNGIAKNFISPAYKLKWNTLPFFLCEGGCVDGFECTNTCTQREWATTYINVSILSSARTGRQLTLLSRKI